MGVEMVKTGSCSWPEQWQRVRLADAGRWMSGGTPSTSNEAYWDGDIPWISGASMKQFRITDSERRVTRLGAENGSRLVDKGAVLFIVRGMSLKSEFRIGVTQREVAFGQDCKALVPDDGIDPYYLAYAMRVLTPTILSMVEETSHGTGRLDTNRLSALEIGVPPLPEQRDIVAANEAFERRIGALERELGKLRVVEQAVVAQTMAEVTRRVALSQCLIDIESGWSPACDAEQPDVGEWGVVKVSAVTSGRFIDGEAKRLPMGQVHRPELEIKRGDILLARANGARSLVGVSCYVTTTRPRLMLSDKVLRLIPDLTVVDPVYLAILLGAPEVRRQIGNLLKGGTGQNNVTQADVRALEVPRLPLPEQRNIVAAHEAFEQRIGTLERELTKLRVTQRVVVEDLLSGRSRVNRT
ncbi:hypothetical protein AQJ11_22385 [Streptomyces corchorusii]|uniref:Type I restriction modification DNA specificity domain-containing protein n=2 Tax=Streptomyces TaxID=1883 RepID=A0A101Q6Z4_STRCK|nr:restriction endonuclease subunit S [Streptomyces corchorusii]KUN24577.1 hypothetical protein AQJ11_22385 [Streptomyces corchorusii]